MDTYLFDFKILDFTNIILKFGIIIYYYSVIIQININVINNWRRLWI